MSTVDAEIEVAALACDLLKETPLSSFDDATPVSKWMKRNFKIIRNIVLAQTPWGFAIKRQILAVSPTKPAFNWSTQFELPRDCLRVLPLRVGGTLSGPLIDYEREGSFVLTNFSSPLKMRYIFEQTDAGLWSPLFVDALSTGIALRMSQWLTGKNTFTAAMEKMHKESMVSAMFANGAEGTPPLVGGTYYDDVRQPGSYILGI